MVTTYKLDTRELESSLLNSIKTTYPNQIVEIEVREQDETEYLLRSPANRERMDRILRETEEGKLISFPTLDDAIKKVKELNRKQ